MQLKASLSLKLLFPSSSFFFLLSPLSPFSLFSSFYYYTFTTRHIRFPVYSPPRVKYNPMSEPTNSTTDPFASGTSDAHGSLYKAIGLSLAIGSSKHIYTYMPTYLAAAVLK